jgi:hypothetical protein
LRKFGGIWFVEKKNQKLTHFLLKNRNGEKASSFLSCGDFHIIRLGFQTGSTMM